MPVLFVFALLLALASGITPASAQPADVQYAQTLRAFNPHLSADESLALADRVIAEADAQGLDARLLVALIATESSWNPSARSQAGAVGLGQFMPTTAADLRIDPNDPEANIHGVAVHLHSLLAHYAARDTQTRYVLALAAYNAGVGAVAHYDGVPPYAETQSYVRSVIALWRRLAGV